MIQKCSQCGTLRHPPRPMCHACRSVDWEAQPSAGTGSVHSYVIMHHPPVPGYDFPVAVALVDLDEGTRIVANVVDCPFEDIHIGMKVELSIENVDQAGGCTYGYSCIYTDTISWSTPTTPLPAVRNPRVVFD